MTPNDLFTFLNLKLVYWVAFAAYLILFIVTDNTSKGKISKFFGGVFTAALVGLFIMIAAAPLGMLGKFLLTKTTDIESIYQPNFTLCESEFDSTEPPYTDQQLSIDEVAESETEASDLAVKQFRQNKYYEERKARYKDCAKIERERVAAIPGYKPQYEHKRYKSIWIWE